MWLPPPAADIGIPHSPVPLPPLLLFSTDSLCFRAASMDITRSVVSERDRALLSGDYHAYHAQASRRIHTLRKRLKATTPKGRKYTPKDPITPESVVGNAE
jgi:RNA-binding signal recognition particle 68